MRLLLGLLVLVLLTLASTSRRWWAYRRYPLLSILTAGGWLTVFLGILLGDHFLEVVSSKDVALITPLVFFALGWVGMMIGLQVDFRSYALVPKQVLHLVLYDLLFTIPVLSVACLAGFSLLAGTSINEETVFTSLLFAIIFLGWTAEVRSLRIVGRRIRGDQLRLIQASSGLASVCAVLLFGIVLKLLSYQEGMPSNEAFSFGPGLLMGSILVLVITAVVGITSNWLLAVVGRKEPEFLVLFFGLVALSAGGAIALGYSPLFVSALAGIAITNISGPGIGKFKRFIIEAERPIATALLLVAGMWASPSLTPLEIALIGILLIGKLLSKLGLPKGMMSKELILRTGEDAGRLGYFRQSPLALILSVELYFLAETKIIELPSFLAADRLIGVLIITGIVSHFFAYFLSQNMRRANEH